MSRCVDPPPGRLLPGSQVIEILCDPPVGQVRHALFDFDGTLSLIRAGWQDVMMPLLVAELQGCPRAEDAARLQQVVRDWVELLTGKQTIYQMIRLAEEVAARGGQPEDPLTYKHRYLAQLQERIQHRLDALARGACRPDDLLVPGSRQLLEALRAAGVRCYLASGTDLPYVLAEARALQVEHYFEGRIYGALDDYKRFSKQLIIDRILAEHGLQGPELVAFGDGYVELENTLSVGGVAVAVASDEAQPGQTDAWKRRRLTAAGAHLLLPDFRDAGRLVELLTTGR
ncbi:MAG: HAD family hydrolase [Fimbriimonadaceae bacterium]|nr:HAD family hydrolase [Fimbriimonadaceae bacterium]